MTTSTATLVDLATYRRPQRPREPAPGKHQSFAQDETIVAFPDLIADTLAPRAQSRRAPEHPCTPAYDARRRTSLCLYCGAILARG
jgi:hypothetical protein